MIYVYVQHDDITDNKLCNIFILSQFKYNAFRFVELNLHKLVSLLWKTSLMWQETGVWKE